jgi:cytidylate kinase
MAIETMSPESKFSLTLSRQLGSKGCEIADAIKDRLGYRVVWRELVNAAGKCSGSPELALDCIDELGLLGITVPPRYRAAYKQAMEELMKELVEEGNVVIVGRAGQVILAGFPNVIHLRIIAPLELRAQRIAEMRAISINGARAQVEASDRNRRLYLKRFYNVRWDDPDLYDLIINSGRVTTEMAGAIISQIISTCAATGNAPFFSHRRPQFEPPQQQE